MINGIYRLAESKNIKNLSLKKISDSFYKTYGRNAIDFEILRANLNELITVLNINVSKMSKYLGFDSSYISHICSGTRTPSNREDFIYSICKYITEEYLDLDNLSNIIGKDLSNSPDILVDLQDWFFTNNIGSSEYVQTFLKHLDNFNLNDYIGKDFSKVKVPTSPVILRNSKIYYGAQGRKDAEAEFLKTTLISKSQDPIYFFSNLPIEEAGHDEVFKQKWIVAMSMTLKKGLHLNIIHNIHRPLNEMLMGLESWIPIYMTGSIFPYYFEEQPFSLFSIFHASSGTCALSGECPNGNLKNGKFYVTTKKEELNYYKEKSNYLFSKAKPLMKIYKENDSKKFEEFINEEAKIYKIINVKKDTFKNIDFSVNKDKWVIINKTSKPEMHFVIYNPKLRNAIEKFLNNQNKVDC